MRISKCVIVNSLITICYRIASASYLKYPALLNINLIPKPSKLTIA